MLPQNADFLNIFDLNTIDNQSDLSIGEKQLILVLLRLFFGAAQQAGAVKNVSEPISLANLAIIMHRPGERFDQIEKQTSLQDGFFKIPHASTVDQKMYIAKQNNNIDAPSYFIYEHNANLVFYVGPDFFHGEPQHVVINCLPLDNNYKPLESYTLRV